MNRLRTTKSPSRSFDAFQVPRRLMQQYRLKNISADGLLLYVHLCFQMHQRNLTEIRLTDLSIEDATGLTELQVRCAAAELAGAGLLLSEVTGNRRANYAHIFTTTQDAYRRLHARDR